MTKVKSKDKVTNQELEKALENMEVSEKDEAIHKVKVRIRAVLTRHPNRVMIQVSNSDAAIVQPNGELGKTPLWQDYKMIENSQGKTQEEFEKEVKEIISAIQLQVTDDWASHYYLESFYEIQFEGETTNTNIQVPKRN